MNERLWWVSDETWAAKQDHDRALQIELLARQAREHTAKVYSTLLQRDLELAGGTKGYASAPLLDLSSMLQEPDDAP